MKQIRIKKNDSGQRLDKFLNKNFNSLPKTLLYKYIRKKRIKVNGKKAKPNYILKNNDILDLYINDEFFKDKEEKNSIVLEKINKASVNNLDILYEDSNIIIVDKKIGMLSHSNKKNTYNTVANMIKKYLLDKKEYNPYNENSFSPALCNRLDRNTPGIIIAAKNAKALRYLNEKIKNKEIKKYYYCAIHGIPKKNYDHLVSYCIKDKKLNKLKVYNSKKNNSSLAELKYKVLKSKNNLSLIEIELITGKSHQIRAQFASIGYPLVGDLKYGGVKIKNIPTNYQALQSYKIIFDLKDSNKEFSYLRGKSFQAKPEKFVMYFI